jgi:citrate synthase
VTHPAVPVETSRGTAFAKQLTTTVWEEVPSDDNPYLAAGARCRGYDLFELAEGVRATAAVFLLFTGELPTTPQETLLETWWILSMSPGPRHPATRAVMNASIGKTHAAHVLPIGLAVLGGAHLGAWEVRAAMRWLRAHLDEDPARLAAQLAAVFIAPADPGEDARLLPGFGTRCGGVDPLPARILARLATLPGAGRALTWAVTFARAVSAAGAGARLGWLAPGVAAACFLDLGFDDTHAVALFQWFCAPGLVAHGNELIDEPLTRMPFPSDDDYTLESPW